MENKIEILSAEVSRLKETEGDANAVCEAMERYEKIAAAEAVKNANVQKIIRMIEKNIRKKKFWTSVTPKKNFLKQKTNCYSWYKNRITKMK